MMYAPLGLHLKGKGMPSTAFFLTLYANWNAEVMMHSFGQYVHGKYLMAITAWIPGQTHGANRPF